MKQISLIKGECDINVYFAPDAGGIGGYGLCEKFVRHWWKRPDTPRQITATISLTVFPRSKTVYIHAPLDGEGPARWSFNGVFPTNQEDLYHQMYSNTYAHIEGAFGKGFNGWIYYRLEKAS